MTCTCPDPECKTTFELESSDWDEIYDLEEPILCPGCEIEYEWDYDDVTDSVTLTVAAEFEESPDEPETEDEDED